MNRERILMFVGGLVIIAPWSGLPLALLEWILPVLGLSVIALAFTMRSRTPSDIPNMPEVIPATRPQVPESRSSHIAFS